MSAPVMSMFATQEECHKARAAYFQQKCLEEEAKLAACERQVNELAEINKELLTALNTLYDHAEGFNVSGVYFNEFMENKAALNTALEAIAKAEEF